MDGVVRENEGEKVRENYWRACEGKLRVELKGRKGKSAECKYDK